mmetsp:Transcript_54723/g.127693  ORF Transcript_54723/g.127693 Transcript_54723/m.127693 type:complete len:311 (-) Transcript_54723:1994-2926(-)
MAGCRPPDIALKRTLFVAPSLEGAACKSWPPGSRPKASLRRSPRPPSAANSSNVTEFGSARPRAASWLAHQRSQTRPTRAFIFCSFSLSSELIRNERRIARSTSPFESLPLPDKFQNLNQALRSSRSGGGPRFMHRRCSCACRQTQTKRSWVRNSGALTSWLKTALPMSPACIAASRASDSTGSTAHIVRSSIDLATLPLVLAMSEAPARNSNQCRASSQMDGSRRMATACRRHSGHLNASPCEFVDEAYPRAQLLHKRWRQTAMLAESTRAVGADLHKGSRQMGHSVPPRPLGNVQGLATKSSTSDAFR